LRRRTVKQTTDSRRQTAGQWILLLGIAAALACGKKGDPQPPLPRGPNAVKDLAVEQEGDDAVLTFTFPDRLLSGGVLADLDAIEVYRVVNPPPALTAPSASRGAPPPPAPSSGGSGGELRGLGYQERRAATNVRLAEEAFYGQAQRVAQLSLTDIAEATRGAQLVYRDPLTNLFLQEDGPHPLAYAVVSVRRKGERSPLSNIVSITPGIAPQAPEFQPPILDEGRVCLEWSAPTQNVLFQPVEIGGYRVYRRPLSQEAYETPLTPKPVENTSFVDTTAPYGVPLAYTVRATLASNPNVEGLPAEELFVVPRDTYPPPAPVRLDALSEPGLVRLLWDPVDASDLAGYRVYRAEADGAPILLTPKPVGEPFYNDTAVRVGKRYRYTVRSVDRAGNESSSSPVVIAEPF
jgi:hypothetical protein